MPCCLTPQEERINNEIMGKDGEIPKGRERVYNILNSFKGKHLE